MLLCVVDSEGNLEKYYLAEYCLCVACIWHDYTSALWGH